MSATIVRQADYKRELKRRVINRRKLRRWRKINGIK